MSGFTTIGKKEQGRGEVGTAGGSIGPFGTSLVSNMNPAGQATFVHGINPILWMTGSTGVGADILYSSDSIMTCSSGTSASGSAHVQLMRGLKYRAGQGGICRMTAIFGTGASDTKQLAGIGNRESGFYFAMSGSSFGILHRETSKCEIRSFTITTPPAGAATLVVTLGGASKSITIDGGGSTNQTSYQISQKLYEDLSCGWYAESIDGIVYFTAKVPGPIAGTFSITNAGVSIATGATVQAGVLPTDVFIPQAQWNLDSMDGNGPSRFTLNPTKGNVYSIGYQFLGFGNPTFSVEDPETGFLADCHQIRSTNSRTSTVVRDPMMTARWNVVNSGSLASSVTIKGASAGVFTEGMVTRNIGISFSAAANKANVSTVVPILSLRANRIYKSENCFGSLDVFNISTANDAGSSSAGKLLKVYFYKNASLGGPVNFQHVDVNRSMAAIDTAATTITVNGAQLIKTIIIAANASEILKVEDENFFLNAGEVLTIAAERVSNTIDNASVSISWFEDQ
jgi:hypothetical protein